MSSVPVAVPAEVHVTLPCTWYANVPVVGPPSSATQVVTEPVPVTTVNGPVAGGRRKATGGEKLMVSEPTQVASTAGA